MKELTFNPLRNSERNLTFLCHKTNVKFQNFIVTINKIRRYE